MSGVTTVLYGLSGMAVVAGTAGAWSYRARRDSPMLAHTYLARNDYAIDPLAAGLRFAVPALELGVWLDAAGRLQAGGAAGGTGNAFTTRILASLAERAERLGGGIHPGQRAPLVLMLEILESDAAQAGRAYDALDAALREYSPLLTRARDGHVRPGAVTVVLTGTDVPRRHLAAQDDRYVFADGNFGDVGAWGAPADLVPVVSEHWSWRFGWDGAEPMPEQERALLVEAVRSAHDEGRLVRFFGVPDRPGRVREAFWAELIAAGVDLITVADPRPLRRYLRRATTKPVRDALARSAAVRDAAHPPIVAVLTAAPTPTGAGMADAPTPTGAGQI